MRTRLVVGALLCVVPMAVRAEVRCFDAHEGGERTVVLENEQLRVVIFPDLGGRIGHLVDLRTGDDLLYWDLSPDGVYQGLGGALDDRRNTFEPYAVEQTEKRADGASVRLVFSDEGITIEKTISLEAGQSSVRVDYVFRNASQQDLADYDVMTKNFLLPSGAPVSEDDLYCIPTSRGVRRITAFSGNWGQYPELRGKFKQDVGPWNALVSTTKQRGIVTALSNDYYRWFYYWKGGVEFPTYEWVFGPLPAGQEARVSLWMHVVTGVVGLSYADRWCAADLSYDAEAGVLRTTVFAAAAELRDARLETEVRRLPDGLPVRVGTAEIGRVAPAAVSGAELTWKPEQPGTYVVRQRLLEAQTVLAEYEEPIVVGEPSGDYFRQPVFPQAAQLSALPGWQHIEQEDLVQPDERARQRGYVLYLDEFASGEQRGKPVDQFTVDMGQGERKSFCFSIRALEDLSGVIVTSDSEQAEIFGIETIDMSNESVGKTGLLGKKLVPWGAVGMQAGEDREVWVRVRSTGTDQGTRHARLRVRAQDRAAAGLEVLMRVRPVALPRPNLISLEAEHSTMILPGCWNAEQGHWNQEVVGRYARDLGEHLTDFEQGFWGWFERPRQPELVRLATTGQTLEEYLKGNPNPAERPPLDLSYLNPVLDAVIRQGLVRFSTNAGAVPAEGSTAAWVMQEAARYLRDRGYPASDLWCKHKDEQPATSFPAMVQEVQWLRQHGFRPFSTFHNVIANRAHMALLNPAFDMFQGGFSRAADRQARLAEGNLDATDEIWMYQGWGATWRSYTDNRRPGWFAAAAELDGYHVHVYYRWSPTDAIIFPSPQGPAGSPAWEGMRDGMSDAQYVALARRWLQRLERASEKDASLTPLVQRARDKLRRAIGGQDSLIRLEAERERLCPVERLVEFDLASAEKARAHVLDLLAELAPEVKRLGRSLYYGSHVLAEDGAVRLHLAADADRAAAGLLRRLLRERFGIAPQTGAVAPEAFVVDVRVGRVPREWVESQPHVTDSYPGPGEYLIHLVEGDTGTPTRTLIFGRDGAGARNGVEQWVRFLRSERRGAVREARP